MLEHCGAVMSGHSMRAGGATALAIARMTPNIIQAAGRWSSDEFQKYIRQHAFLYTKCSTLRLSSRATKLGHNGFFWLTQRLLTGLHISRLLFCFLSMVQTTLSTSFTSSLAP
ncbi:hypothetical protein DFJ58DRAFT_772079 [Suillus subalutaceus]|uniref:uncharacterized protein n=1 Tax=Suillus subalutaceus TaxID=48586 RepID=UPI001B882500|nr:uncharacterized protein DFJ58DRAFT_772079 [Suillus subalutaceus]KAG1865034.1 hypothetical protein DFJ58DRAFT_772079 [Suillus subalutaceus]